MKKLIFFTREHNDVDHVLPLIYYLHKIKNYNIEIYNIGNRLSRSHILYKILENEIGINVQNLEDIYNNKKIRKFTNNLYNFRNSLKQKQKKIFIIPVSLLEGLIKLLNAFIFVISKKHFLTKFNKKTILADFGTEDLFPYHNIIKLCKKHNIPIYAYAHGVNVFSNLDPIRKKYKEKSFKKLIVKLILRLELFKFNSQFYDKYLVGVEQITYFKSTMYKNFNKSNLKKVCEIGIPRYTTEWINILDKYYNKDLRIKKKINVCLFLSNEKYNVDKDKLMDLIIKLTTVNNIHFVIKGHTRIGLSGLNRNINEKFITYEESNNIIANIDIAIIYGTSITFQALQKKVPVVLPSYIDNNDHIFTKYNACFNALSQNQVIDFINNFDKQKYLSQNQKNIEKFINKIVYDYKNYDNMMGKYDSLLKYEK